MVLLTLSHPQPGVKGIGNTHQGSSTCFYAHFPESEPNLTQMGLLLRRPIQYCAVRLLTAPHSRENIKEHWLAEAMLLKVWSV